VGDQREERRNKEAPPRNTNKLFIRAEKYPVAKPSAYV
jgi:hypothetical protein